MTLFELYKILTVTTCAKQFRKPGKSCDEYEYKIVLNEIIFDVFSIIFKDIPFIMTKYRIVTTTTLPKTTTTTTKPKRTTTIKSSLLFSKR